MEPNFSSRAASNNDTQSKQNHFLSLRKAKRNNLQSRKLQTDKTTDKYKLNQNSFENNNKIIQNFFDAQDKPAYLHQLLSNLLDAKIDSNLDQNLIKFIILQSLNYYDSQKHSKEGINSLENFFTDKIFTNLIEVMNIMKQNYLISYNICYLLLELTFRSEHLTKVITLNKTNIEKIFDCLYNTNEDIISIVLSLIYNCYMEDEDMVNQNCNIGVYVMQNLFAYSKNYMAMISKSINITENLKILVSFIGILVNSKTSQIYKQFGEEVRNQIIYFLIVLCRDVLDENLKLDAHYALGKMLNLAEPEDINVDEIGLCNIANIFLSHIKLELNNPEIIEISMEIIEKFSYLCDVEVFGTKDLIEQLEQLLIDFNDMNINKVNPKPYYSNFRKKTINHILNNLCVTLTNIITLSKLERFVIKKTNIVDYLTLCLKINELENETIVNIYGFFKELIHNKDNCVKVILANFIDVGILDVLKNNLNNKNYEVIQQALDICLIMMKESSQLTNGNNNVIKMYLEKKGFNDLLNVIIGADFGNMNCSEVAKSIQDGFFK